VTTTDPAVQAAPDTPVATPVDVAGLLSRYGVYLALVLLFVVNVVITDNFLTGATIRLQLVQVAPILVVALGMALVIGTEGIDLSVGSVMAIAAAAVPLYIGYGTGAAIGVALLLGLVSGLLAGVLVAYVGVQPIVATLGLMVAGRGAANLLGGQIKTISDPGFRELGIGGIQGVPWLGSLPWVVLIAAVLAVVVLLVVLRTTYGRQLVAIGGNKQAAQLAGLPVRRILLITYVVCALLATVAGLLVAARSQASDPTKVGLLVELSAITAVVVGGTPLSGGQVRVVGTVAGALLMQLITATLIFHDIADSTAQMVQALIVVAAVWLQLGRRRAR
jgi:galactofuranose transport system permease protein